MSVTQTYHFFKTTSTTNVCLNHFVSSKYNSTIRHPVSRPNRPTTPKSNTFISMLQQTSKRWPLSSKRWPLSSKTFSTFKDMEGTCTNQATFCYHLHVAINQSLHSHHITSSYRSSLFLQWWPACLHGGTPSSHSSSPFHGWWWSSPETWWSRRRWSIISVSSVISSSWRGWWWVTHTRVIIATIVFRIWHVHRSCGMVVTNINPWRRLQTHKERHMVICAVYDTLWRHATSIIIRTTLSSPFTIWSTFPAQKHQMIYMQTLHGHWRMSMQEKGDATTWAERNTCYWIHSGSASIQHWTQEHIQTPLYIHIHDNVEISALLIHENTYFSK